MVRERAGRAWHAATGDWKYPAAIAVLLGVIVLTFTQYRQWTGENDVHSLTQVVIRQNDDLRKQIDSFSATSACRAQINATVNSTFGQVVNVQGQETATVGQMIVALFQSDRVALAADVDRLSAVNQQAVAANTAYQTALNRQADATALCTDESPTTTVKENA